MNVICMDEWEVLKINGVPNAKDLEVMTQSSAYFGVDYGFLWGGEQVEVWELS